MLSTHRPECFPQSSTMDMGTATEGSAEAAGALAKAGGPAAPVAGAAVRWAVADMGVMLMAASMPLRAYSRSVSESIDRCSQRGRPPLPLPVEAYEKGISGCGAFVVRWDGDRSMHG